MWWTMGGFKGEDLDLELNPPRNGEPMELVENGGDVVKSLVQERKQTAEFWSSPHHCA